MITILLDKKIHVRLSVAKPFLVLFAFAKLRLTSIGLQK